MVDDNLEGAGSTADSGKARRAPPTIDLEATKVNTAAKADAAGDVSEPAGTTEAQPDPAAAAEPAPSDSPSTPPPPSGSVSPWVIAPFSGAVGAALVIAIGWMLGWPQVTALPPVPQVSASAVNDLSTRVAGLEAEVNKQAPSAEALGQAVASLRSELADLRTRSDQVAATVNELKSAPSDSAGTVDLSGINDRIAQLERASRAQGTQIAQDSAKIADSKAADDLPLRRLVAASLLDVAVRHGDPYQTLLATAKSLADNPDALKPLDAFAATGVPNPFALNRELLALVSQLSPAPLANVTPSTSKGLIDRLQAGAAKLVRIERTDVSGNDRGAVVARMTEAALHNDLAGVRRELSTLSPADRAPAQAWLDKAAARDAALAASRQFADETMAALAKPAQ